MNTYNPTKTEECLHGPYPILKTRTNGTVVVKQHPWLFETYNIRKIVPYKGSIEELQRIITERNQQQNQFSLENQVLARAWV